MVNLNEYRYGTISTRTDSTTNGSYIINNNYTDSSMYAVTYTEMYKHPPQIPQNKISILEELKNEAKEFCEGVLKFKK